MYEERTGSGIEVLEVFELGLKLWSDGFEDRDVEGKPVLNSHILQ